MAHAARHPQAVSHLVVFATVSHAGYVRRAKELVAERGTPDQIAQCAEFFDGRIDTVEKMSAFAQIMGPLYACSFDPLSSKNGFARTIWSPEAQNRAHSF